MPNQPPIQRTSAPLPGVKLPVRETDYIPPSRTQVKNEWRSTAIPVYAFKAWKMTTLRLPSVQRTFRGVVVRRTRDWFPVVSLDFSVTYSFRPYHGPGVDSAPSENEYQEHFLGVKAAGIWCWQPHHLHVPNVMKSGSLNLLESSGPYRACYGIHLPFTFTKGLLNTIVHSLQIYPIHTYVTTYHKLVRIMVFCFWQCVAVW